MFEQYKINNITSYNIFNHSYLLPRMNKKIPYNERYETVDFYPRQNIIQSCPLVKGIKPNKIPFHERYETIDFSPRK
uniref:Uncharacterized protein n=1 Tax=viral metagenome TaxID=1070528 RepID=A0A6C0F6U2_9ZZZZ